MPVDIYYPSPNFAYTIREWNKKIEWNKNIIIRYIVLDAEDMKRLSELLKGLGF